MTSSISPMRKLIVSSQAHLVIAKSIFTESFIRGLKWASLLVAGCVIPLVFISLFFPEVAGEYTDPSMAAQVGLASAILAAGSKIHWITSVGDYDANLSGSIKLSLITLMIQLGALRYGRRIAKSGPATLYIPILITSIGFASLLFASGFFLHNSLGIISLPKLSDFVRLIFTVGVPMSVGAIFRNFSDRESVNGFRNSLKALRYFAGLLTIATVALISIYIVVEIIRPDFEFSVAPFKGHASSGPSTLYVLASLLGIVLNFPAIVIAIISLLAGISLVGSYFSSAPGLLGPSNWTEVCLWPSVHCESQGMQTTAHLNLVYLLDSYSLEKRAFFVATFLFIVGLIMSLSSNFSATNTEANSPLHRRVLRSAIAYSSVGAYLVWLVNGEVSANEQATSKLELNLAHGTGTVGLAAGSVFAIAAIFAFMAGLATGKKSLAGLRIAFPRIARNFGAEQLVKKGAAKGWRVFGLTTTTVFTLTILLTFAGAIYELQYAKQHGPAFFAKKVELILGDGDVAKFKKLVGSPKGEKWLNEKIMQTALPKSSQSPLSYKIENSNKGEYATGQLDPVIFYSLGSTQSPSTYPLNLTGSTHSLFHFGLNKKWVKEQKKAHHGWAIWLDKHFDDDYLTAAKFKYIAEPVKLRIAGGAFMPSSVLKKLTLNGEKIKQGTYNTVPGHYHFKLPAYRLIAETDLNLATSKLSESVVVGNDVRIPPQLEKLLSKRLQTRIKTDCKLKPKKNSFNSSCFWDWEILDAKKLISGKTMRSFDKFELSNVKANKLSCGNAKDSLLSASALERVHTCKLIFTFKARLIKSAVYEQGDPIYREVPIYQTQTYDACPGNIFNYCWTTRQVQIGTDTQFVGYKRGPLVSPRKVVIGTYRTTLNHNIWINGYVGAKSKYRVTNGN